MKYLLDTHILLWSLTGSEKLPSKMMKRSLKAVIVNCVLNQNNYPSWFTLTRPPGNTIAAAEAHGACSRPRGI